MPSRSLGRTLALAAALWVAFAPPANAADKVPGEQFKLDMMLPTLRLGFGAATYLKPPSLGFAAEVEAGAQFMFQDVRGAPIVFVQPLCGYMHAGADDRALHAFTLGLGVGVGTRAIRGMLRPRFIAGAFGGETALGLRTGLALEGWMGALGLEVGHEVLSVGGEARHGARFVVSTDLVALGLVVVRKWWQG